MHMNCPDIHINVQDASGDRVLAADMLRREPTNWHQWIGKDGIHKLGRDAEGRVVTGEGWHNHEADEGFGQEHVHDIVRSATRRAKWAKTPRIRGGSNSCRIFGSLSVNKVMGDFHITARGHGYMDFGSIPTHLNHDSMCSPANRERRSGELRNRLTNKCQHLTSRISSPKCPLGHSILHLLTH